MKSKSEAKAKQAIEVKQEKTVEVKEVRKPRTNLDRVKAVLKKQHPELSEKIKDGDAMFIANRFLQNAENREKMALELKLDGRCGMCASPVKGGNCPYIDFPSTGCRNGLLGWLDTEA